MEKERGKKNHVLPAGRLKRLIKKYIKTVNANQGSLK